MDLHAVLNDTISNLYSMYCTAPQSECVQPPYTMKLEGFYFTSVVLLFPVTYPIVKYLISLHTTGYFKGMDYAGLHSYDAVICLLLAVTVGRKVHSLVMF